MQGDDARADAIVVAAGSSRRMDGIDKLTHEVGGRPLLAWSIDALAASDAVERIVVVTAPDRVAVVRDASWLAARVVAVVPGGDRRHESVAAGLAALDSDGDRVVLVHDGARPMPSAALVSAVAHAAAAHGAAIPVVPVTDTLKHVDGDRIAGTVDRSALASAQTPQGARAALLRQAFERFPASGPQTWTDEAALLEACRIPVHALPGEPTNLKVTVPADLARVDIALGLNAPLDGRLALTPVVDRVGTGLDSHPFGPGAPLVLGGVEIPGAPRLHGHSDGDVALHAIADALLGAAGLGDLGRLFPADPATPKGIASGTLLAAVVERLADARLAPRRLDVTIVGARPRLAPHLEAMRAAIAGVVGIDPSAVSVKASTGNLGGDEGAGRSMSALAVAVVGPLG
jgi:2-C-methyl-D-erythritol 4-phosphate cytidylyltransferase / 2-C-methyl-D-erythritol 2,4-cyclodiphosphate synthase